MARGIWRAATASLRKRHLVLVGVILVHAFVVAILFFVRNPPVPAAAAAGALRTFDVLPDAPPVPEPQVPPPPVPPPVVEDIAPLPIVELPVPAIAAAPPPTASAGAAGPSCDLTQAVQRALRESKAVGAALLRIPVEARSVANAVMLWDGAWVAPAAIGGEAVLEPIQAKVIATVEAASQTCRMDVQAGPRLVLIPGERETLTIAIGSGSWRWGDLARKVPAITRP